MSEHVERTTESIGYWTYRVNHGMSTRLNRLFAQAGHDVTIEQWKALMCLWDQDGQTQGELGRKMYKEQSATTRIIDNLVKRSLVVRVPNPEDSRSKKIYLTHMGQRLEADLSRLAMDNLRTVTRGIEAGEMENCLHVLARICANLDEDD